MRKKRTSYELLAAHLLLFLHEYNSQNFSCKTEVAIFYKHS